MANLSSVNTNFFATASETFSNNLSSSISSGATIVPVNNASAYTTGDIVVLTVDPGTSDEATFIGKKDTGNQFIDCIWTEGNTGVGHSAGAAIIDYTAATHQAALVKGIKKFANQDGSLVTQAVRDALGLGTDAVGGWEPLGYTPSAITHNGNRSYTLVYTGVNLASTVSENMKLRINKTVAGNGYMAGLMNGSSHYFTRTAAAPLNGTLGTVTNNFTIEVEYQPTSYALGFICGRADAAANNGLGIRMDATGQVTVVIWSGGIANFRTVSTYQSLPLNKKTHIAASWTSGTVVVYFDGVSVPVAAAATGGTAPTTAGTGGDFSIGRLGAYTSSYANGYISNAAVFDAVLSAATIKQHATYKLLGSETNCIGAWSLDNTANDQSSAGNNLTATGGVGYTAMTPHGQLGNGVETTKAVGLVMSCTYSTDTTMVVQVPEGVTIPTTGGISSVEFSTQANPFGWVSDKGRWEVGAVWKTAATQGAPVNGTWYNINSSQIAVPVGKWGVSTQYLIHNSRIGTATLSVYSTLSTANNTESDNEMSAMYYSGPSASEIIGPVTRTKNYAFSTVTNLYLNLKTSDTTTNISFRGDTAATRITATPSGL